MSDRKVLIHEFKDGTKAYCVSMLTQAEKILPKFYCIVEKHRDYVVIDREKVELKYRSSGYGKGYTWSSSRYSRWLRHKYREIQGIPHKVYYGKKLIYTTNRTNLAECG